MKEHPQHREFRASHLWFAVCVLSVSCVLFVSGCGGGDDNDGDGGELPTCVRDDVDDIAQAVSLEPGAETEGWLCPRGDQDWYSFSLPPSDRLVRVHVSMNTDRSPVEPVYAIFDQSSGEAMSVAAPPADDVGSDLDFVHCLPSGDYTLQMRDQNDDAQDIRHPYALTVSLSPEPDAQEPNDDQAGAIAASLPTEQTGYVSCAGDSDWYKVEVPADSILQVELEMEQSLMQPHVRLIDANGELVQEITNPAGAVGTTSLNMFEVIPVAGTYYVVVDDDDDRQADPDVPYTLLVRALADTDPNEPNDRPVDATRLSGNSLGCGAGWSQWFETPGTVGAPGDNDWFEVNLMGCERGLIEAEMTVIQSGLPNDQAWELQSEVQASIALIREERNSPCNDDQTCRSLSGLTCQSPFDCEGYFGACLEDGFCGGTTACLPTSVCGANMVERHYTAVGVPANPSSPPPANEARLSSPILGNGLHYLRVGDFQGNGGTPNARYVFRYRVRQDPDVNEPNNILMNTLTDDIPVQQDQPRAVPVSLGCGTMTEGALSYENDRDWYVFDHPCPGSDCMLQVRYEVDEGPVEHVVVLYQGGRPFFDRSLEQGTSGNWGPAANQCLYAFQKHENPYYLMFRDLFTDARDWSSDQRYRFCVESPSASCDPPCQTINGECNAP